MGRMSDMYCIDYRTAKTGGREDVGSDGAPETNFEQKLLSLFLSLLAALPLLKVAGLTPLLTTNRGGGGKGTGGDSNGCRAFLDGRAVVHILKVCPFDVR